MGHCVRLIIPDVPNDAASQALIDTITGRWGGVTMTTGRGLWRSDKTGLLCGDNIAILEVSIGRWSIDTRAWWVSLANRAREEFGEECVFLSVRSERAWLVCGPERRVVIGS